MRVPKHSLIWFIILLGIITSNLSAQTVIGRPIFENVLILPDYCQDFVDKRAGVGRTVWVYDIRAKQVRLLTVGNAFLQMQGDLSYQYNAEFSSIEPFFPNDAEWHYVFRLTNLAGRYTHRINLYWSERQQKYYVKMWKDANQSPVDEPDCGTWELDGLPSALKILVEP